MEFNPFFLSRQDAVLTTKPWRAIVLCIFSTPCKPAVLTFEYCFAFCWRTIVPVRNVLGVRVSSDFRYFFPWGGFVLLYFDPFSNGLRVFLLLKKKSFFCFDIIFAALKLRKRGSGNHETLCFLSQFSDFACFVSLSSTLRWPLFPCAKIPIHESRSNKHFIESESRMTDDPPLGF